MRCYWSVVTDGRCMRFFRYSESSRASWSLDPAAEISSSLRLGSNLAQFYNKLFNKRAAGTQKTFRTQAAGDAWCFSTFFCSKQSWLNCVSLPYPLTDCSVTGAWPGKRTRILWHVWGHTLSHNIEMFVTTQRWEQGFKKSHFKDLKLILIFKMMKSWSTVLCIFLF